MTELVATIAGGALGLWRAWPLISGGASELLAHGAWRAVANGLGLGWIGGSFVACGALLGWTASTGAYRRN